MLNAAVIDLGSNSLRMGIYTKTENGPLQTERYRFSVRLAEGLYESGYLQDAAMTRTLNAFQELQKILAEKKIEAVRAVATEAMRRAGNADDFAARVKEKTGIKLEIISGEEETKYGVYAAKTVTDQNDFYVLDTGGGSFELSLCQNGEPAHHSCLPYGAVVLTDRFCPDQNGDTEIAAFLRQTLADIPWLTARGLPVVMLGGSNRLLAKLQLQTHDEAVLDGFAMQTDEVFLQYNRLFDTPLAKREMLPGMEKNRIDTAVAGVAPLLALLQRTNAPFVITCMKSLMDGVAAEIL